MNGSHMIEGRRSVRRTLRNHTTVGGKRGLTNGVATDISGTGCGLQWCIEGPAPRTCKERWRVCPPLVPAESSAGPCVTTLSLAVSASCASAIPLPPGSSKRASMSIRCRSWSAGNDPDAQGLAAPCVRGEEENGGLKRYPPVASQRSRAVPCRH